MENETELAGICYVGGHGPTDVTEFNNAPSGFPEHLVPSPWKRLGFVFALFSTHYGKVASNELECHGYKWSLELDPGDCFDKESCIGITLRCGGLAPDEEVHVKYCMRFGYDRSYRLTITSDEAVVLTEAVNSSRKHESIQRKEVLAGEWQRIRGEDDPFTHVEFLDEDGSFLVDVDIQVGVPRPPPYKPVNSIKADMAKVLDMACEENSDVIFQVDGRTFHCFSGLLQVRAPELYALSEDDKRAPIPISGVSPDTFQLLMLTLYGGEIPENKKTVDELKALISAADRFGCTNSKLLAEHELVESNSIGVDNVAELLLFADGTNCALIKEAAIACFLSNPDDARKTKGYARLKESPHVLEELMIEAVEAQKKRPASPVPSERDYKRMRISHLRSKLDDKGLDVDGSREMLMSRLEEADAAEAAAAAAALTRVFLGGCIGEVQRAISYMQNMPGAAEIGDESDVSLDNLVRLKALFLQFETYLEKDIPSRGGSYAGENIFNVMKDGLNATHSNYLQLIGMIRRVSDFILDVRGGAGSGNGGRTSGATPKLDNLVSILEKVFGSAGTTQMQAMARAGDTA